MSNRLRVLCLVLVALAISLVATPVLAGLLGRTHVSAKRVFSGFQRPRTATKLRVVSQK